MRYRHNTHRFLAAILTLVMLLSLLPMGIFAAESETIQGAPETIKVSGIATGKTNINKGWKFYLGTNSTAMNTNFDDSAWKNVDLPHDFSISQNFTSSGEAESGFLPGGTGWYRKSITMPAEAKDKTILLNFDGVYMHATVYVNGTEVGQHHYGYTNFAFDITDYLVFDGATENVVAVKAVNNIPSSRWYSGSGIYRDVDLLVLEPVHVDLYGTTITTPNIANNDGTVNVKTDVVNDGATAASVTVTNTVYKKDSGTAVATATATATVNAGATIPVETSPTVSSPALWSVESPNLYTLVTEITVDGKVCDTQETEFGFRWTEWKSTGFYLNGKAVKLNGVCMHHDQGALGSAAYYDAMYRQLSIMKDMGCNAIRTSHNPADEQYIAICNELGLLVIEEAFDGLLDSKNGNGNDFSGYFESAASDGLYGYTNGMTNAEYAARSMVKRDRNAPSVIAWSFGNEVQQDTNSANTYRYDDLAANFITWVNKADGTRPVTCGDNTRGGNSDLVNMINTITNAGGVAGFNYANSASELYSLAQSFGGSKGVIIASETSSAINSRGMYKGQDSSANIDGKYHLTSYDTSSVSWGITAHDSIYNTYQYDCVAGEFVWTGFDYIGEPTPWNGTGTGDGGRGAIPNSSYFGIVETTGFPKDSFYLYRAQWNKNATTVHLVTAWDDENQYVTGGKTPVWVYTNAAKVELYLNDDLIGTTIREANTSAAGHTYYTYTATSNEPSVCSAATNSGADALYTIFNVKYSAGTLTAKAYDENGAEITLDDSMGQYTISTPGTVTQLKATPNKTKITADGSSLVYIEVDVLDANGNLDTTATNNITFTLTGNGEIVGVDNGDQATTAKYQQSSVLASATSANINAYAGKALVIVRSTEDAGNITVNITSSGLTSQTVNVVTEGGASGEASGLVSYTMVKDYSVKTGTAPTLDTTATGTMADGSTVTGTIAWNTVGENIYGTHGDYTITGALTFPDLDPIQVTAKLHVIPNVIVLRNVSTAVMEGTTPTLPSTVSGVLADGTLAGEFPVTWNLPADAAYENVGDIITVTGTAVIFGAETMDVTCTIRVAEALNTESRNAAISADTLTEDIESSYQSDNLESIRNGILKPGDNTNERWTNWNNRTRSATATLTFYWNTAVLLSHVNMYYYDDGTCDPPESVEFSYSLNGNEYQVIGHAEEQVESYSLGYHYVYTFDEPINPVYLKVKFTQKGGTSGSYCLGLTELELMTYAASFTTNTSADLSGITVAGSAVSGFAADTLAYEAPAGDVAANTAVNAGITVLPVYEGVVRILTVSEDGSTTKTYAVTLNETGCAHEHTEIQNASDATCTTDGNTGDTYCTDCQTVIAAGTVIPATGHQNTETRNAQEATCTDTGFTGDTYCTDCGVKVSDGKVIKEKGHFWNEGEVTKEPTETEAGEKRYTCTACGETKTEVISSMKDLKMPSVSVNVTTREDGKLILQGVIGDFENLNDYYEITARGLLYIHTSRIGTCMLTTGSSGRTRVTFSAVDDNGAFTYIFRPTSASTQYALRAFLVCKEPSTGKSITIYSDMICGSFDTLK